MLKLFTYQDFNLTIEPEVLLLKPFRRIWERDKSKKKNRALSELGYIYFFTDSRSPYIIITDLEERATRIKAGEGLSSSWAPDKLVKEAITFYESFKSHSELLLEDSSKALTKIREYLNEIDLHKVDIKGKPIYSLTSIISALKQIPILIKSFNEILQRIQQESKNDSRVRGGYAKTVLEDDLNL